MTDHLLPSIQRYFSGKNARDFSAAVSGFAESAVVKDEGREHRGRDSIRVWIEETTAKYDDQATIKSVAANGDAVEVAAEVAGTFPGSPIVLRFRFTLGGDQIGRLEIAP